MEKNGFDKSDMELFDTWAAEPKPEPKPMAKRDRTAKYGDQKWRLTQVQQGGHDTIATSLYPRYHKENAIVAKARKGVTLTESTSWKESTAWKDSSSWKDSASWKDSSSWKEPSAPKETPSSSSTSWNQSSWQAQDWQGERSSQSKWLTAPWNREENQWKRHKW